MSRPVQAAVCAFGFICAVGVFCGMAGGVEWGTFNCGMTATLTSLAATVFSAGAFFACGGSE